MRDETKRVRQQSMVNATGAGCFGVVDISAQYLYAQRPRGKKEFILAGTLEADDGPGLRSFSWVHVILHVVCIDVEVGYSILSVQSNPS